MGILDQMVDKIKNEVSSRSSEQLKIIADEYLERSEIAQLLNIPINSIPSVSGGRCLYQSLAKGMKLIAQGINQNQLRVGLLVATYKGQWIPFNLDDENWQHHAFLLARQKDRWIPIDTDFSDDNDFPHDGGTIIDLSDFYIEKAEGDNADHQIRFQVIYVPLQDLIDHGVHQTARLEQSEIQRIAIRS